MKRAIVIGAALLALPLLVRLLSAQAPSAFQALCNAAFAWSPATISTNTSGPASAPVNDTAFNPLGNSYSYFPQGNQVYAVRNVADAGGPAGSIKWTWQTPTGATIASAPTPVLLTPTGQEVVFVTSEDGFLHKINAADGITGNVDVDTRRVDPTTLSLVCAQDQLIGPPVVQLNANSTNDNNAFKNNVAASGGSHAANDDVVFVSTYNRCNDHTHNRVIAYWASNMTVKWTFNANTDNSVGTSLLSVDASAGCALDYGTDTLFCGTLLQNPGGTQDSLWAINTLDGVRRWSANAGSILNRPALSNGRLYAAGNVVSGGSLQAYDLAADPNNAFRGLTLWTSAVAFPGYNINRNLWPVGNTLLVVDTNSTLSRIQDGGSAGTILWQTTPQPGVQYTSAPVAVASVGKAYIGRSDGTIQEIDLATGQAGQVVVINPGAGVFDPSLDIEGGASDFNRLVVVADAIPGSAGTGVVTRLIIPFCLGSAPSTTTVSSSANPSVFGQNVTFTASVVASGSVTPGGSVTFLDGNTPLGPAVTLTNGGPATFMINTLSVGTHTITAQYSGDTNFASSTSAALSQTVNQAGTTTTLTASPNPANFGQAVTFTATVTVVAPGAGTPTAPDVVTFLDGTTALGPASLSGGGTATLSTSSLASGSHSITATYGGDANFNGSTTASSVTVTVQGPPPPVQITDNETVHVADVESFPDVFDGETVKVADAVWITPLIQVDAPAAEFSAGALGFSGQSGSQTITVSDIGTASLTVASATISGSPQFAITQIACSNSATSLSTVLPSGGICAVTISYTASATPTNDTGVLTFADNAALSNLPTVASGSNYAQSIPLNGSGTSTAPPPPPPAVVPVMDNETISVTDTVSFPDVFDTEAVHVADAVFVTPLINVAAPVVDYSAGSLGFGNVAAGQTGTQSLTLSDIGQAPLAVSSAVVSQGSAFTISQIACSNGATSLPTTLQVGGACTLLISYAAPSVAAVNDVLTFTDNAALSNVHSVVAGTSYTQSIALYGSGTSTPPPPPPPAIVTVMDNETINVMDSVSFPDVFDAEAIKVIDAVTVTPLINVGAPVADYSAGSLGFGNVAAGQTGTQSLTLSDIGQASLLVSSAAVSQNSAFSISQIACSNSATSLPTTLPVGGACIFLISYLAPTGAAVNDMLTFTDNATLSNLASAQAGASYTQSISLNGSGTNTPPPPPPPAVVPVVDNETIHVTDTLSFPDVFDSETITVSDQVTVKVISSPTTTFISAAGVTYGTPATATVSVSSSGGTVTGNVTLSVDGGAASSLALSGGSATFSLGVLSAGNHNLAASFAAQGAFDTSSATSTITISQASSTVTVNCPVTPQMYTGAAQTPCTAVYKTSDGLSGALTVSYTNNAKLGTAAASASYAGDANHAGSSGTGSFTISQASSTVTVSCPATPQTFTGAAQTPCTASYSTSDGLRGALTVSYTNNTNVGTATASASYAGDANHAGSSGTGSFTIIKANQTIILTGVPASANFGQGPFTLNASATSGLTVALSATGNCLLSANSLTLTAVGSCTVTATQPGNGNYNPAPTLSPTFAIGPTVTTTNVSVSPATVQYSDYTTLTATVSPTSAGGQSLSGSVQFYLNGTTVGSPVAINASGVATLSQVQVNLAAGSYTVKAVFSSTNANFAGNTGTTIQNVTEENAFILYSGGTIAQVGTPLNLRATVWDSAAAGYPGVNSESGPAATIGDITKMWIAFDIYPAGTCGSGTPSTLYAQVALTGTTGIGAAMTALSSSSEVSYCIVSRLVAGSTGGTNLFYTAPNAQAAGLDFYVNSGQFATGGGWVNDPTGSHGNFGFNARYNSTGSPKGQMVYVYRALYNGVLADFIIKSNALTALQFTGTIYPISSTLQGKANVQVNRASDGYSLFSAGNYTFSATVTDSGQSGVTGKQFSLVVYDSSGVPYHQVASGTPLQGGNVVVHSH